MGLDSMARLVGDSIGDSIGHSVGHSTRNGVVHNGWLVDDVGRWLVDDGVVDVVTWLVRHGIVTGGSTLVGLLVGVKIWSVELNWVGLRNMFWLVGWPHVWDINFG